MSSKEISIIIPCLNEERYISSCLDSILNSDYNQEYMEILVVDGMSEDNTREIVKEYEKKHNYVKLIDNIKKTAPIAMNIGINNSVGEFIFIISAHAKYDKNYFSKLVENIIELDASCVGPLLITDVKNKTKKSNSIKKVLSHKLGVGNASFRTGSDEIKEVDTVAFGCYKRDVFDKYGLYDERLTRNQDIELNKRIKNGGGKIYLIPNITCTYFAREDFSLLAKNNFDNGRWNILTAYYTKTLNSLSLRHFIPLLFVLSIILPIFLIIVNIKFIFVSFLSFILHFIAILLVSIKINDKETTVFNIINSFYTLHFSYGVGSIKGIIDIIIKKIKGS
ncbi:MAG: glycosyltransferase family 2 protein [Campylobacterota bacterium]|nr:glycosyltransferase family 2 protein [Campylobacterota bacterium]